MDEFRELNIIQWPSIPVRRGISTLSSSMLVKANNLRQKGASKDVMRGVNFLAHFIKIKK